MCRLGMNLWILIHIRNKNDIIGKEKNIQTRNETL